jgi:predicted lipoprotein with Yx(FWY)xxD motif
MKRIVALLAVLLLGAGLAACGDDDDDGGKIASSDATTTTVAGDDATTTTEAADETTTTAAGDAATGEAVLAVANTSIGEVLVDADGMTLYMFKPDTQEASACTEGCAQAWPPLTVDGTPAGGDGVDPALLGTAARDDGSTQVTYNGHRHYTYSGDTAPGDTTGHGVGDNWYALTASGEPPA